VEDDRVDITILTDEELEAQRLKIEKKPRPLTLDRLDLEGIQKEQERRRKNAPDPRKMRGCGKLNPDYQYRQGSGEAEKMNTPAFDPCGHLFQSPPFGPLSILLCRDCAIKNRVAW
jgi:hypothetical protein